MAAAGSLTSAVPPVVGGAVHTPQPLVALLWGFRGRVLQPTAKLAPGDLIRCSLIPDSQMGEGVRALQRIDDIEELGLPLYYAARAAKASETNTMRVVQIPANVPVLPQYATPQAAISNDLSVLRARLAAHGGWDAWYQELEPVRQELAAKLKTAGGPLILNDRQYFGTIRPLTDKPTPSWDPPVHVLSSLARQLRDRGIDLIVVPVPEKEHVTGQFFLDHPPKDAVLNPYRSAMHVRLLDAGVEVIDLQPALIEAWTRYPHVFYDAEDEHPADGAVQTIAEQTGRRLARYGLNRMTGDVLLMHVPYAIPEDPHYFSKFGSRSRLTDAYVATAVLGRDGHPLPETEELGGQLLLMCDSFGRVPRSYGVRYANLPYHLVHHAGVFPRLLAIEAGAPQMVTHLARSAASELANVRVCVFVLNERFLRVHLENSERSRWVDGRLDLTGGQEH